MAMIDALQQQLGEIRSQADLLGKLVAQHGASLPPLLLAGALVEMDAIAGSLSRCALRLGDSVSSDRTPP